MNSPTSKYGELPGPLASPAVRRMATVASLLGERLCERVVFIGASLLPLMETEEHVINASRVTDDVDAVVATVSYTQKAALEEALRDRGFRHAVRDKSHMDRWLAPNDLIFDCVSCGDHPGGTGSSIDRWMIDHAVETSLPPLVRHASAVGLLLLKLAAYADRGLRSPITSKDLSDIATLLATRPELPSEVHASDDQARRPIVEGCRELLASARAVSAIRSHISSRQPLFEGVDELVLERLRDVASAS